ncbi:amino acid ABC transporter substrate-binding protein [Falsiroseomonas selenitidurans]|uniref:Amino acid ABC transporter substrate-binding protein n=1 Tax=Falsiroseomonas selenitidurans TaxID=2716335 RepID=A0ABX1E6J5_9PROT|nr:amino acid ABC transporter substrate-binding protein [Falsiroseomonas selenitidurans]NKC32583.1 amino acid ABC transporter substrate-binding protein [Falsiroseomonas selenitidurans]OYW08932.1 MAG: amino acid ABC transporter substrate-binding protein [Rhodospirillales bacterium 12-71-4]
MKALRLALTGAIAGAAMLAGPAMAQAPGSPTLDAIRARGTLVCGVNTGLAGFAQPDSQGVWRGFDVDYCRAVAVALWNDASKVRYVPTTAQNRFTALQSGEVDMLARNTTWTLSRDTSLGFDFPAISFFDGQGFMVKASAGVRTARDLNGATICVQPGTTTEQNLTDWARSNRIRFTPVVIERVEEAVGAYVAGRCDAYTTDVSGLAATRSAQPRPAEHQILPDVISKEPLAPAVRHGDQRFADLVKWIHFGLVGAEELGITAANVQQAAQSDARPDVQRMLGRSGELGQMLGVDNAWMVNIIRTLGNYGEIFERNLAPIGLQRGPNALWTNGGLQYAPPLR